MHVNETARGPMERVINFSRLASYSPFKTVT